VQIVAASAEYVPTAHATHAVDASASKSALPASHGVQLVCKTLEYCPGSHITHAVAGWESRSAKPALQAVHELDPAAA
jgi:hypothetical protein